MERQCGLRLEADGHHLPLAEECHDRVGSRVAEAVRGPAGLADREEVVRDQ